eukprot:CAMPEP_0118694572 /NCGR_PEP_ID=MMETSP0800-20121206/12610_1 /TAXON_ID=210618 ORGANISM="Striatella unipunctata, Strain CCMP2910" /NCGR_SAMPLE_ID=MMETSP0800 /ASSEMBLY_ACC=CAM_ASM_000638 /LENGTH=164 /DNA_ID=CAMNT_0006593077 /DNA_START=97 /DNA_END=592 /DNA_ORIENTATION=-
MTQDLITRELAGRFDVLCGKAGPGVNLGLKDLAHRYAVAYRMAQRGQKSTVCMQLIQELEQSGGRFWVKNNKDGFFYEAGFTDEQKIAKVKEVIHRIKVDLPQPEENDPEPLYDLVCPFFHYPEEKEEKEDSLPAFSNLSSLFVAVKEEEKGQERKVQPIECRM